MVKILQRKYIILGAALLLSFLAFLLVQKVFFKEEVKKEIPPPKIEIDFRVLESQALKELEPFEKIEPFEDQIGRENPFLPY